MKNDGFDRVLEEVARRLVSLPKGDCLLEVLRQNQDYIALLNTEEIGEIEAIRADYGTAGQDLGGKAIATNFHDYLNQVINPLIVRGEITDGSQPGDYDDRKARWSGAGVTGNWHMQNRILFLEIGPTIYPYYALDLRRDKTESLQLMLKGLVDYCDPYAYFSKAIGITVVPISQEGSVYIGERSAQIDNPGLLNFVAGLATFHEELEKMNFYMDIQQELKEEIGIDLAVNVENTRFIGIAGNPWSSENDLVFVIVTPYPDSHFKTFPLIEHTRFVPLRNKNEVKRLLDRGLLPNDDQPRAIAYGSKMALEYLVNHHF
jgi:8-oxo-dGTP pyrophosphatase MutT (NUDIX family)